MPPNPNTHRPLRNTIDRAGSVKLSPVDIVRLADGMVECVNLQPSKDVLRTVYVPKIDIDETFIDTEQSVFFGKGYVTAKMQFVQLGDDITDVHLMLYRENQHTATEILISNATDNPEAAIIPYVSNPFKSGKNDTPEELPRDYNETLSYLYDLARVDMTINPNNLASVLGLFLENNDFTVTDELILQEGLATTEYLDHPTDNDIDLVLHNAYGRLVIVKDVIDGKLAKTHLSVDVATLQGVADPINNIHPVAQRYSLEATVGTDVVIEEAHFEVSIMPMGDLNCKNGQSWASTKADQILHSNIVKSKTENMGLFSATVLELLAAI